MHGIWKSRIRADQPNKRMQRTRRAPLMRELVATVSAFLTVGFSLDDELPAEARSQKTGVRIDGIQLPFGPIIGIRNNEVSQMLRDYIQAAMRQAKYEILPDDGSFYGEIPSFDGVYANADKLEKCREELEEVLEEWILMRVSQNLPLPVVEGIELVIKETA